MRTSFRRFRSAGVLTLGVLALDIAQPALWIGAFIAVADSYAADNPYDQVILADQPAAFWDITAMNATEPDLTGNGNDGVYIGGLPLMVVTPNGDMAADFNGSNQYLSVPWNPAGSLSIPTTGDLTWVAWVRPDVLQFANGSRGGYVDYLGKCDHYSPTCEWEAGMYSINTDRPNRLSAYVFNPTAGLGSGAFWQPADNLLQVGQWLHVVGEYTTLNQPDICSNPYPGAIDIWVNGMKWNQSFHGRTGCMSQYSVIPKANNSPLNIGSMAYDTWFQGAIAKVAIYNYLLTQDQIANHYTTMTGQAPTGSCAASCTF